MFTEAECSVLVVLQELNNGTPYCTSCLLIRAPDQETPSPGNPQPYPEV